MNKSQLSFRNATTTIVTLLISLSGMVAFSQPGMPQRSLVVTPSQSISFGKFCLAGNGGTITVNAQGVTTSTGGIVIISSSNTHPAIFEIKLCPGRNISFNLGGTTHLSNGGATYLDLVLDSSDKGLSFSTNNDCNFITSLRVGGTLTIPGGAQTGIYSGNFELTFNQQ